MAQIKIVFTDYYYPNIDKEIEILNSLGNVEIIDCCRFVAGGVKNEEGVIRYAHDADAIIVQFAPVSKRVIDNLEKCAIIARYAIGLDNIDLQAAKEKGIVIANVPDYCIEEVSDSAFAHIFNCLRKLSYANRLIHRSEWDYAKIKPIRRLSSQTIGLLAFGNISRRLAEKLLPWGSRLLAHDPYIDKRDQITKVEFVSLEELLSQSDILSIHAPLTSETRHLINRERISLMKDGVIIVNTSRGGLIDEKALEEGIVSGKIAMAGLDVLDCPDTEYSKSPLCKYPDKVFITPHMGWYSEEAITELQMKTAKNVLHFFKEGHPLYAV